LEAANARLNKLAFTDSLTGIANRKHFYDIAKRELVRLSGDEESAALIMFDLDYFKRINDTLGHEAGDTVIKGCVASVQETIRPMDLFGRYGGEEFLILLPNAPQEIVLEIAERIRRKVQQTLCVHDNHEIHASVSLGVSMWNGRDTLEQLIY